MRALALLAALAAFAFAHTAAAAPVALAPIALSEELQTDMAVTYGEREAAYLQRDIADQVAIALQRVGAEIAHSAPITIEITLVDARPNRPTFKQLGDNVGLDYGASVSRGGAELRAVLRGSDGAVLREVEHERYAYDLATASLAGTWGDARRAIRQFARRVADAYVAQTTAGS